MILKREANFFRTFTHRIINPRDVTLNGVSRCVFKPSETGVQFLVLFIEQSDYFFGEEKTRDAKETNNIDYCDLIYIFIIRCSLSK